MSDTMRSRGAVPCPYHGDGWHIYTNQGRSEPHCADLYRCPCGATQIGNTDGFQAGDRRWT